MADDLTDKQKTIAAIKEAKRILVFSHERPDGDTLGANLALTLVLKKLGKDVFSVCSDAIPEDFKFLSALSLIKNDFAGSKDFIISLSQRSAKAAKLSYHLDGDNLRIIIVPETGNFIPKDVAFSYGEFNYDLIIILDTAKVEMLGSLYLENAEMFYKTHTLNIDHHGSNSFYADINLIEESAAATSEVIVSLIESLEGSEGKKLLDPEIATALLLGIMTDTNLFGTSNTTPKTMTVAAQLIAAGAKRDEIVDNVFKKKPIQRLKVWGKILFNMEDDQELRLVWSHLSFQEVTELGASAEDMTEAINDLLFTAREAEIALLLKEKEQGKIKGSIRSIPEIDIAEFARVFGGGGHKNAAGFEIKAENVAQAENFVLVELRKFQEQRLGDEKSDNGNIPGIQPPIESPNQSLTQPQDKLQNQSESQIKSKPWVKPEDQSQTQPQNQPQLEPQAERLKLTKHQIESGI